MTLELEVAESDEQLEAWRQVRLVVQPGERTAPVEETRRRIAREPFRLYLLAYDDGELVGSGFAGRSDLGQGNVMPLVPEERRGRGIGSAILDRLIEQKPVPDCAVDRGDQSFAFMRVRNPRG